MVGWPGRSHASTNLDHRFATNTHRFNCRCRVLRHVGSTSTARHFLPRCSFDVLMPARAPTRVSAHEAQGGGAPPATAAIDAGGVMGCDTAIAKHASGRVVAGLKETSNGAPVKNTRTRKASSPNGGCRNHSARRSSLCRGAKADGRVEAGTRRLTEAQSRIDAAGLGRGHHGSRPRHRPRHCLGNGRQRRGHRRSRHLRSGFERVECCRCQCKRTR